MRELHHAFTEVCLDDFHAQRLEIRVQLDLLARHRLDLGHHRALLPARGVPADLPDDLARLGRTLRVMGLAADGLKPFRECLHQLGQSLEIRAAAVLQVGAAGGEVEILECGIAAAAQPGHRMDERALKPVVVEGPVDAPREVAPGLRHALGALRESPRRAQLVLTPAPSIWSRRTRRRGRPGWGRSRRTDPQARPRAQASRCQCLL